MKSHSCSVVVSAVCAVLLVPLAHGQPVKESDSEMELQIIEDFYVAQRAEASKPIESLTVKYRAALEKARTDFQTAGNLDGVLEAQRALTEVNDGLLPDGKSADVTIAKYEAVYLKERTEVEKSTTGPIQKAQMDRLQSLESLAVRLTKAGKIDAALEVRSEIENAKRNVAAATKPLAAPKPVGEPVVEIISAVYGSGDKVVDVTKKIREFVTAKREFRSVPQDIGVDPVPGWNKWLAIKFKKDGVERKKEYEEGNRVQIEFFYGPQDAEELANFLAGTEWKAGVDIIFSADQTFIVEGRIGSYRWSIPEHKKLILNWSAEEQTECVFNSTWTGFEEQSGKKRLFRKVK